MELNKEWEVKMLPGVCQGEPGAGARHDSMCGTSGRELRRLAPVIQQAAAQYEHWNVEKQEKADEKHATLSASLSLTRRTAHRRDRLALIKWSHKLNIETMFTYHYVNWCKDNPQVGWRHCFLAEFTKEHPDSPLKLND